MIYNWYKIINKDYFDGLDIPSKELEVFLDPIGLKTVFVSKGEYYSLLYDNVFLPAQMNGKNPFEFEGYACYVDANDDIWLGVPVE